MTSRTPAEGCDFTISPTTRKIRIARVMNWVNFSIRPPEIPSHVARDPSPAFSTSAARNLDFVIDKIVLFSAHGVGDAYVCTQTHMEQPYFIRGLGRRTHLPALYNEARSLCDVVQFQRGGMD
jgi:hypothetical protein